MAWVAETLVLNLKELRPGAMLSLLNKLTEIANYLAPKFSIFGAKLNYIELLGDELRMGYSREVASASVSIAPLLLALIPIIKGLMWLIGIAVVAYAVHDYTGMKEKEIISVQEQREGILDFCSAHPEQCPDLNDMLRAIDSSGIDWSLITKVGLGAAGVAGGLLLVRALWPEKR